MLVSAIARGRFLLIFLLRRNAFLVQNAFLFCTALFLHIHRIQVGPPWSRATSTSTGTPLGTSSPPRISIPRPEGSSRFPQMLVAECGLLVPYAINERTDATEAEVFFCCMFTINAMQTFLSCAPSTSDAAFCLLRRISNNELFLNF